MHHAQTVLMGLLNNTKKSCKKPLINTISQGATTVAFDSSTKMTVRIRTLDKVTIDSDFSFILVRS